MALIDCPDCGRKLSEHAKQCPDCACPLAEVLAQAKAEAELEASIESREATDRQVDCPQCAARGFYQLEDGLISWCVVCEYTGRATLCRDAERFYAVAPYAVERFVNGELNAETSGVVFAIGPVEPTKFRYEKPATRRPIDPSDPAIPWTLGEGDNDAS